MSRARIAHVVALVAGAALAVVPRRAASQCPSQASCPNPCTQCRVPPVAGTTPDIAAMAALFDRVAAGPLAYGDLGWDFGGRDTLREGAGWCGGAGAQETVPAHFPCVLLKAVYATESNWRQFCASGRTVVSFDCGYGIAQVTSGMRPGETSAYDADRVASSPAYNVSVGAAILADKWRAAPCVGDHRLDVVEHWYFAVWGYNGFAFSNNPNNPMYAADRPVFRTPGVASARVRGNYPYQEVVWGYAHYPPSSAHYAAVPLVFPARSEICPSCGRPTEAVSEPPGAHRSECPVAVVASDAGLPSGDVVDVVDVAVVAADTSTGRRDDGPAGVDAGCACRARAGHVRGAGRLAVGVAVVACALGRRRRRARSPRAVRDRRPG